MATAQKEILAFLHSHPMATISTVDSLENRPESALIAFAELPTLEIIFETFFETRKYNNLQHNANVALVVGWDVERHITVQYEGMASLIPEHEIPRHHAIFLQKKTPCTEAFLSDPRVRLFKVRPTWICLSDYTGERPRIVELRFDKHKRSLVSS